MTSKRVMLSIHPQLYAIAKKAADEHCMSIQELIQEALRELLVRRRR